jgi:hypothetical protein
MTKKRLYQGRAWASSLVLTLAVLMVAVSAVAEPWKFGVMSDTQWPNSPDGKNPNVAVNVINHINQEFIDKGVKFVVQVGDLTDKPGTTPANPAIVTNLDIRATFAQDLYNAGIGFYPLRGNHEDKPSNPGGTLPANFYGAYAREFQRIFPQTQTGVNNLTPMDAMITTTIYGPQENTSGTFAVGSNFASEPGFEGLTYSFDYDNARFVLIDQFTKPSGASHSNLDATDVAWIGKQLSTRPANTHAFVFGHKHLISENHNDNLFNSTNPDTASAITWPLTNTFMSYLQDNGVRYYMGGHDHMHNRAIITSPDGFSMVQNIIAASDSYKFYIPPSMAAFATQTWRSRETQIAQELFAVGYYIVTVDGPKVTVEYYAMPNGCNGDCDQTYDVIPYDTIPFTRHETFGYSLNGKEVLVPQGGSYALTDNTTNAVTAGETGYIGTTAAILSGTNGSTGRDYNNRALTKTVNTGWAPAARGLASDILTLWGMSDSLATDFSDSGNPNYHYKYVVPGKKTDEYTLSMTYYDPRNKGLHLGNGGFRLAAKNADGNWVNAVDMNAGRVETKFMVGPWKPDYPIGTYGIDTSTHTVWAVINYNGDFAAARGME